eukprot:TRINITY_DN84470_c0_g1_i1.p1 TRINITY_DN84470_c0_g1~~TRINITY_DN84470_c0_g1_i1.p1  ORF type:complete len:155 (+),score=24.97 TRINITY_DN84470_c0_g1_i1:1-465(+)
MYRPLLTFQRQQVVIIKLLLVAVLFRQQQHNKQISLTLLLAILTKDEIALANALIRSVETGAQFITTQILGKSFSVQRTVADEAIDMAIAELVLAVLQEELKEGTVVRANAMATSYAQSLLANQEFRSTGMKFAIEGLEVDVCEECVCPMTNGD